MYRSIFLFVLFWLPLPLAAQAPHHMTYGVEQGLPTNLVKDVFQDETGYLWIGTDEGLVRTDGRSFTNYTEADGLPSNYVKSIFETRDGALLVVTDLGVVRVEAEGQDITFPLLMPGSKQVEPDALFYPKALFEDRAGDLWVSGARWIYRLQAGGMDVFPFPEADWPRGFARSFLLAEDDQGRLLVSSEQGGLYRFDGAAFRPILLPEADRLSTINALLPRPDGSIWLGGDEGIFSLRLGAQDEVTSWERISSLRHVHALRAVPGGTVYVGTYRTGLYHMAPGAAAQPYDLPGVLAVNSIRMGRGGQTFVATDTGLHLIHAPPFAPYLTSASQAMELVRGLPDGSIVMIDGPRLLHVEWQGGALVETELAGGLENPFVLAASPGRYWVGTRDGELMRLEGRRRKHVVLKNKQLIFSMAGDDRGGVWVTQHETPGVSYLGSDLVERAYGPAEGLPVAVNAVRRAGGQLYVLGRSDQGYLFRYDAAADRFVNLSVPPSFDRVTDLSVQDLAVGPDGALWLGSNHGVLQVKGGVLQHVAGTPEEGEVRALAIDSAGGVWAGTSRSLSYYSGGERVRYTRGSGLANLTSAYRSIVLDGSGYVWAGNYGGVSYSRRPSAAPAASPRPVFRSYSIGGHAVEQPADGTFAFSRGSHPEVRFTAIVFPNEQVQYQTRIVGRDQGWSPPTTETEYLLAGLPTGAYTLEVRAQQAGRAWSEPAALPLVVRPAWYETPLAFYLYAFTFLLVGLGGWSYIHALRRRRRAERALRSFYDAAPALMGIVELTDEAVHFISVNEATRQFFGQTSSIDELSHLVFGPQETAARWIQACRDSRATNHPEQVTYEQLLEGTTYWLSVTVNLLRRVGTGRTLFSFTAEDVTERQVAEDLLRESEERFRLALANAPIGIGLVSLEGRWLGVNQALCELVGYTERELLEIDFQTITHPEDLALDLRHLRALIAGRQDTYRIEKRYFHRAGNIIWVQLDVSVVRDSAGAPLYFISQIQNITERRRAEAQLRHAALHDPLTGLPNRKLFIERLEQAMAAGAPPSGPSYAVLFLDLDGFKAINDTLGHHVGDEFLVAVARRLEKSLRSTDTVARMGGDEFAALLQPAPEEAPIEELAERIQTTLSQPVQIQGQVVSAGASIGVVFGTRAHTHPEEVLREADASMYRAKAAGRGQYVMDRRKTPARTPEPIGLAAELPRALERGEFEVYYQPIVALASGRLSGFEALVRWRHPEHGLLLPGRFLPQAEEMGLVEPLSEQVLRQACRQLSAWQRAAGSPDDLLLMMSVNVSRRQVLQPESAGRLLQLIDEIDLDPTCLILELTEDQAVEDLEALRQGIQVLDACGVRMCLDDFGTGYASMELLLDSQLDILKLDRLFVQEIAQGRTGGELVHFVSQLAERLGMDVVAEGIETAEQLRHLRKLGCTYGQGFLFAPAVPVQQAEAFLTERVPWEPLWLEPGGAPARLQHP